MITCKKIEESPCKCCMLSCKKPAKFVYTLNSQYYEQIFPSCRTHLIDVFTKVLDCLDDDVDSDDVPKINI